MASKPLIRSLPRSLSSSICKALIPGLLAFLSGPASAVALEADVPLMPAAHAAPASPALLVSARASFDQDALEVNRAGEFTTLMLSGGYLSDRPGEPSVPTVPVRILLPDGSRARSVRVVAVASVEIPVGRIYPLQNPELLGLPDGRIPTPVFVPPRAEIYSSREPFPRSLGELTGTGQLAGHPIAAVVLHPIQYFPLEGKLLLHTELEVEVLCEAGIASAGAAEGSQMNEPTAFGSTHASQRLSRVRPVAGALLRNRSADVTLELLRASVLNPEAADLSTPGGQGVRLDPNSYEYLIITPEELAATFEPLAQWKTQKGVRAAVITVEEIAVVYPGVDDAEKIRNFLKDARDVWGTIFVLLGGDSQIVRSRWAWAMECQAGFDPEEDEIHADLYFSDLDGTWDADGNGTYGETTDDVDLYPDLYVGRAPVDDVAQAATCVNKFLTYEKTPPADYQSDVLFFSEILWSDPYTDSAIGKDMIDEMHFDPLYDPITKLYESLGNESSSSVLAALNDGPHFVNHTGHGWINYMGTGDGGIDNGSVDALYNADRTFLIYSIGCWTAAFDRNSIAEHFLINPDGGAFAFVGNDRYGWGSPGNPGLGYSERFDQDFYGAILSEGFTQLGVAVAEAKIRTIPYAQDENVYRIHQYQLNLMGDPESMVYTRQPTPLAIAAPAQIPVGEATFTVVVSDLDGGVAGARVCISGADEAYAVGLTDAAGNVVFELTTTEPHTLTVTATAQDRIYAETPLIVVDEDAPFLTYQSTDVDDDEQGESSGNGNGEINPGETVELCVTLGNIGSQTAAGITATLTCDDAYVTIHDNVEDWNDIAPGETAECLDDFDFTLSPDCPAGRNIVFDLAIVATGEPGGNWTETFALNVVLPDPTVHRCVISELSGDGDDMAEPGETVALAVILRNDGCGTLSPATATLSTSDPDVLVDQGSAALETPLAPGSREMLLPVFELEISPECPLPHTAVLDLFIETPEQNWNFEIALVIGETGFSDDVESGPGDWTHSGAGDLWHISTHRAHSGDASWYCGDDEIHLYNNNMDASLTSPAILLPHEASLRFWRYFDVTIYGVDGLFVEINAGSGWEVIDYLGSGGALGDSLLFMSDWAEMVYPLEDWPAGTSMQVRFHFKSDGSDRDEGFYIDDVVISGPEVSGCAEGRDRKLPLFPARVALAAPWPNPFSKAAAVHFTLGQPAHVRLAVFDLAGRKVRTLVDGWTDVGYHPVAWNGRDAAGLLAPTGVYYLHLEAGGQSLARPLVRVR